MPRLPLAWFKWKLFPFLVWVVAITFASWHAYAFDVPPLEGRVNDHAGLLSEAAEQRIAQRLAAHEQATGVQLAVLTVDSLNGVPIEDYSIHVVEAWKLGKKGQDNGVLLLIARRDRKMRIEVGYGLEGTLPDIVAGRIVRDILAPEFKRENFERGITRATEAIIGKTGGTVDPSAGGLARNDPDRDPRQQPAIAQSRNSRSQGVLGFVTWLFVGLVKFAFFAIFIVIFIVFSLFGRGRRSGGGFYVSGGGGSSGGGFGGGGFSGGGGGFGGGGASGDW